MEKIRLKKHETNPLKLYFNKSKKFFATCCAIGVCFTPFISSNSTVVFSSNTQHFPAVSTQVSCLPSEAEAMQNLVNYFQTKDSIYLLNDTVTRLPYPSENKPIKLNFIFTPTEEQKVIFETAVEEYNNIFKIINPKYKFQINYHPTEQDLADPYGIDVKTTKNFSSEKVVGTANTTQLDYLKSIDGVETYHSVITLHQNLLKTNMEKTEIQLLTNIFKHEFLHLLGAGEAYKNKSAPTETIMQSASTRETLYPIDVAFIDAYYRQSKYSDEFIKFYITSYNAEAKFGIEAIETKIMNKKYLHLKSVIEKMDKTCLINFVENSGYNKEDIKNFCFAVETFAINEHFGEEEVKFAEIPKEYTFPNGYSYKYMTYKVPTKLKNQVFTNYYFRTQQNINDYELNFSPKRAMSLADNNAGILNPMLDEMYISIGEYVLNFNIENEENWYDIDENNIQFNPIGIYKITNQTAEEYFEDIFTKSIEKEFEKAN